MSWFDESNIKIKSYFKDWRTGTKMNNIGFLVFIQWLKKFGSFKGIFFFIITQSTQSIYFQNTHYFNNLFCVLVDFVRKYIFLHTILTKILSISVNHMV